MLLASSQLHSSSTWASAFEAAAAFLFPVFRPSASLTFAGSGTHALRYNRPYGHLSLIVILCRVVTVAMEATGNSTVGEAPAPAAGDASTSTAPAAPEQQVQPSEKQQSQPQVHQQQPQKPQQAQQQTTGAPNSTPQRRPQIAPRDKFNHQSLGASLNSTVKQVRLSLVVAAECGR